MGVAYRFRNATTLLSKKELEDQYVYFSSPQNLNDPNEGLRNMVWKGDKIVWDNFLDIFCGVFKSITLFFNSKGKNVS